MGRVMFESLQQWFRDSFAIFWPYLDAVQNTFSDYSYLQAAFLAALGFFLARLLSRFVPDLFKNTIRQLREDLAGEIVELTRFPLFNLIFMGGLLLAVHVSGLNAAVAFALSATLKSTMIAVVAIFLYRLSKLILTRAAQTGMGKGIIQPQTLPLFTNTAMVFVLVGASHQIFAVWNVDMTALLASAGIAGIALGMAAQGMLADVIAGILILTDGPYRLDDLIRLETHDREIKGKVIRIGIRSTRILTEENVEVIVPNSVIGNSRILNDSSAKERGRVVRLEVVTACGVDSSYIRGLLLDIARANPLVLADKGQSVDLLGFDGQVASFELMCWVAAADEQDPVAMSLREAVYRRFLQENIPLALPVREEVAVTHMADSRQEIRITDMPDRDSSRTLFIKEIPNLFGSGAVKGAANKPVRAGEGVSVKEKAVGSVL